METNYFNDYFESALTNLSKHINNPDLPAKEKEKLKIRIELINEFKEKADLQIKYPSQEQYERIQYLVSMRKTGTSAGLIEKQKMTIEFYDLINTTIPYIEAVNLGAVTKPIMELCNTYIIDFADSGFNGNLPDNEEIKKAFKAYFENVALVKFDMYKECYEKIEYLYTELKTLSIIS